MEIDPFKGAFYARYSVNGHFDLTAYWGVTNMAS